MLQNSGKKLTILSWVQPKPKRCKYLKVYPNFNYQPQQVLRRSSERRISLDIWDPELVPPDTARKRRSPVCHAKETLAELREGQGGGAETRDIPLEVRG